VTVSGAGLNMKEAKESWVNFYHQCTIKSPLSSYSYADLWFRSFSSERSQVIYRIHSDGELLGFIPFSYRKEAHVNILNSLTEDVFPYYVPLIRYDREKKFKSVLSEVLYDDRRYWDVLIYKTSYSFAKVWDPFLYENILLKYFKYDRIRIPTYCIKIEGEFNEYVKGLHRKVKKNMNYLKNLYKRSGEFALKHYVGEKAAELWPVFLEIEDSGWKGRSHTSIKKFSKRNDFFFKLNQLLADEDALHLFLLELNGEYIAGEWSFVENGVLHALKSGYHESYKKLSPSNFLFFLIIEFLFERKDIKLYHMFPGGDQYKHRFTNVEHYVYHTFLFSPTFKGRMARQSYKLYMKLKKVKRYYRKIKLLIT